MANAINSLNFGNNTYTFTLPYGVCETASETVDKVVTVDNFSLETGAVVIVKFTYANSIASPTLNVNGSGAKPIYRYGTTTASTGTTTTGWVAGAVQMFTYDGTGWIRDYWNNTTYSNASLGCGYVTCSTAASTKAKTGTLSSYSLTTGGIVSVKFTNAVPASATLNINSKGAKNIYFRGAAITADVIKAGDIATFVYSSQYHLIAIDRWQNDIVNLQTAVDAKVPTSRTVNGKALSSNITLSASDVGADASGTAQTKADAALASAKSYTDGKISALLDGASDTTLDSIKELADAIKENDSAIDALNTVAAGKANASHTHDDRYYTETEVDTKVASLQSAINGKAASSHGNHVPITETANNARFLRNDNTWATVTPANIGAQPAGNYAASTHTHESYINQNAFSNIAVSGQTTVAADTATDTVTFAGSNVSITTNATTDKVTFSVADASTSAKGVVQLTDSTNSTSTTTAATPNSVNQAYTLAGTANNTANSAKTTAESKSTVEASSTNGKIKINGTDTTVYTHPTTAGNKHIPSGGSSGQVLKYSASGTATWGTDKDTTYSLNSGDMDGTIKVTPSSGSAYNVAVKGLGSVAYTDTVPIAQGGTGATTAAGALTNLGITATAAELNYCDGVTSNIQKQLKELNKKGSFCRTGYYGSSWTLTNTYQDVAGKLIEKNDTEGIFYVSDDGGGITITPDGVGYYLVSFRAQCYANNNSGSGTVYGQITVDGEGSYEGISYIYNGYATVQATGVLYLDAGQTISAQMSAITTNGTLKTDGNDSLFVIKL